MFTLIILMSMYRTLATFLCYSFSFVVIFKSEKFPIRPQLELDRV